MSQYDLIREGVERIDLIYKAMAIALADRMTGVLTDDPITLADARRFERIVRRTLRPFYGPARARAASGRIFRDIAQSTAFASGRTVFDVMDGMDRAMRSTDPGRWAQVRSSMASMDEGDGFARMWVEFGGPHAQEVRRVRAGFIQPNTPWAGSRLSDRVWDMGVRQRNDIFKRIRVGVRRGESVRTIADHIVKYMDPDYAPIRYEREGRIVRKVRTRTPHGTSAARRLVRTEVQRAAHESTREFVDTIPVSGAGMRWRLSAAHPRIDICDSLARGGTRGYGPGVYRPQDFPAIPHPQCLCSAEPVMPPREVVLNELWARYMS